ncbi:MAG: MBL fold metallo-hydrolase [Propionibacteriaceae bacterium]
MDFSQGSFTLIAPRVWRAVCQPDDVNVALIAGDDAALIVDTGSCPEQGQCLRDQAETLLDVPLQYAVVTHAHSDHWWGLSAFKDLHTIGHESLSDELAKAQISASEHQIAATDIVLPKELVSIVSIVQLGNRFLEIVHPGAGHTTSDLFVTIADAKLVIAGDIVEEAGPLHVDTDSDIAGWVKAIDMMLGTMRRDALILPGHGELMGGDIANWQRQILNGILTQTKELIEAGTPLDQALTTAEWPWDDPTLMQSAIAVGYWHWEQQGIVARPQLGLSPRS